VTHLSQLHRLATREERSTQIRDRKSIRLVSKELSGLWKIPTPEGHSISELFRRVELAAALNRLKPGKSPGLDSINPVLLLLLRAQIPRSNVGQVVSPILSHFARS